MLIYPIQSNQLLFTTSSPTFVGLTLTGLTAGRIPYITTAGLITDSANLTFDNSIGWTVSGIANVLCTINSAGTQGNPYFRLGTSGNYIHLFYDDRYDLNGYLDIYGHILQGSGNETVNTLRITSATANSVLDLLKLSRDTSGTPATGIGVGIPFYVESAAGLIEQARINVVVDSVTSGSEFTDMIFKSRRNGALTTWLTYDSSVDTVDFGTSDIVSTGMVNINSGGQLNYFSNASTLTNTVLRPLYLSRLVTSGVGVAGVGVGLSFYTENGIGELEERATIDAVLTDVTDGSEDCDLVFNVSRAGTVGEAFRYNTILDKLTTSYTIEAEQLTSTDDITMAGLFTNTMAAADATGFNIDGTTNDYSYSSGILTINTISRDIAGSSAQWPSSFILFDMPLNWNHTMSGNPSNSVNTIYCSKPTIKVNSSISRTGVTAVSKTLAFECLYGETRLESGTTIDNSTSLASTLNINAYGAETATLNDCIYAGTKTINGNMYGGRFSSSYGANLNYTGSGTLTLKYYGGYFSAVGNSVGNSTSYGGYFSGTGSDTNYDIYAANASSLNYFAGPTTCNTTLDITGLTTATGGIATPKGAITLAASATAIAATKSFHVITGDGATNTIATITGGVDGMRLTLLFVDALVTITDTDAHTANTVDLSAAFTSADDTTLELIYDGTSWYEISRSVN